MQMPFNENEGIHGNMSGNTFNEHLTFYPALYMNQNNSDTNMQTSFNENNNFDPAFYMYQNNSDKRLQTTYNGYPNFGPGFYMHQNNSGTRLQTTYNGDPKFYGKFPFNFSSTEEEVNTENLVGAESTFTEGNAGNFCGTLSVDPVVEGLQTLYNWDSKFYEKYDLYDSKSASPFNSGSTKEEVNTENLVEDSTCEEARNAVVDNRVVGPLVNDVNSPYLNIISPNTFTNSSASEVPGMASTQTLQISNIDYHNKIKLERKRMKNRIAAARDRRRKLDRLLHLQRNVLVLRGEVVDLNEIVSKLKQDINKLKHKVNTHVGNGCLFVEDPYGKL